MLVYLALLLLNEKLVVPVDLYTIFGEMKVQISDVQVED